MSTATQEQRITLTEKDVAQMLGVSDRTVWQLRKDGKIRCIKIGASVKYTRANRGTYMILFACVLVKYFPMREGV